MLLVFVNIKCFAFTSQDISIYQHALINRPLSARIVFWADKFVNTPYDQDPQGIYVTQKIIVTDQKVDCMYLVFRCVELASSNTPQQAVNVALDKRFFTHGIIENGEVSNYDQRFQYGEDMIVSGKWGKEVTAQLGQLQKIPGTRGHDYWYILPTSELAHNITKLKTGDLIFFVKDPQRRSVMQESVGHMGIIEVENSASYLINAHGTKSRGGKVEKVLLSSYLKTMPFIGAQVTRFGGI